MKPVVTPDSESCAASLIQCSTDAMAAVLSPEEMQDLAASADIVTLDRGARLIEEGAPGKALYHVLKGSVQLTHINADGQRLITGFLFQGDFAGVCVSDRYPFSAETIEPTIACRFEREALLELGSRHLEFERRMLSIASNEFLQCLQHLEIVMGGSVETKLARFLLSMAERVGVSDRAGRVIELPMRREAVADYLGHSPEATSRAFTRLREAGVISIPHRSCVAIENERELEATALRAAA